MRHIYQTTLVLSVLASALTGCGSQSESSQQSNNQSASNSIITEPSKTETAKTETTSNVTPAITLPKDIILSGQGELTFQGFDASGNPIKDSIKGTDDTIITLEANGNSNITHLSIVGIKDNQFSNQVFTINFDLATQKIFSISYYNTPADTPINFLDICNSFDRFCDSYHITLASDKTTLKISSDVKTPPSNSQAFANVKLMGEFTIPLTKPLAVLDSSRFATKQVSGTVSVNGTTYNVINSNDNFPMMGKGFTLENGYYFNYYPADNVQSLANVSFSKHLGYNNDRTDWSNIKPTEPTPLSSDLSTSAISSSPLDKPQTGFTPSISVKKDSGIETININSQVYCQGLATQPSPRSEFGWISWYNPFVCPNAIDTLTANIQDSIATGQLMVNNNSLVVEKYSLSVSNNTKTYYFSFPFQTPWTPNTCNVDTPTSITFEVINNIVTQTTYSPEYHAQTPTNQTENILCSVPPVDSRETITNENQTVTLSTDGLTFTIKNLKLPDGKVLNGTLTHAGA